MKLAFGAKDNISWRWPKLRDYCISKIANKRDNQCFLMWASVTRETTANCHVIATSDISISVIFLEVKHEKSCYSSKDQAYFVQIWQHFWNCLKIQSDMKLFYRWILEIKIFNQNTAVSNWFCWQVIKVFSFIL